MIVLIKSSDGGVYPSVVFAYRYDGLNSEIIAFTPYYDALTVIKYWKKSVSYGVARTVFETDKSEVDFVNGGRWRGFDWIVNDSSLIKSIEKGREISDEILQRCKAMQSSVKIPEWNELNSQAEISTLLDVSYGFHDGVVQKITETDNGLRIEVKCLGCIIVLDFINVTEPRICAIDWRKKCIIKADVRFEDGEIIWEVDSFNFYGDGEEDLEYFIKAEKILYKIIIDD